MSIPCPADVLLACHRLIGAIFVQIMGKGIPDIVAGHSSESEGNCATNGRETSSPLVAGPRFDESPAAGTLNENDGAHDAMSEGEGGKNDGAGVDKRILLLDRARRWMADAGAKAAGVYSEAKSATESDATRRAGVEG